MHHDLEVVADPDAVASTAAAFVARLARPAVINGPAAEALGTYEVREVDGVIQARI